MAAVARDEPSAASRRRWSDVGAGAGFIAAAFFLTARLWSDVPGRALEANGPDQAFFEWMLAHGARVVTHLENPFVSTRMNVPDGVNLMANTSILGLSVPLSPVTLLFGPHPSFTVLLTLAFAATGIAWYYVLSRHVVASRGAAAVGAAFCAVAPGMVSHGNGHPNIVAQFLVPFIILWTLRLREPSRTIRHGVVLGLLIAWQAFINEEILLLTALGLGGFTVVAALLRSDLRRQAKPFLAGLGVAALVAGLLLAYPLWVQFFGPGAYRGLRPDIKAYGADLASFPSFATRSLAGALAGDTATERGLAQNATEENTFFGWPLLALLAGLIWWMRRNTIAVALTVVAAVFALAALGPKMRWYGDPLLRGPWSLLLQLPLFDSIVPTRFALAIVAPLGVLLALAVDRWRREAANPAATAGRRWLRYALPTAFVVALLPIAPTPLADRGRQPTPALFTSGRLRDLVSEDSSVVFVPPARNQYPAPLYWAAGADLDFRMAHGYFLGPVEDPARPELHHAIFTAPARPTATLLNQTSERGAVPEVTAGMRQQAVEDLRYWRAAVLVLVPGRNRDALRSLTNELVGFEPQWLDGAWVWDVREVVA